MMDAGTIVALLRTKHAEDVFVDECKDGPTHYGHHLRMDAWAMKKKLGEPHGLSLRGEGQPRRLLA